MKRMGMTGLILLLALGSAIAADKAGAPAKAERSMTLLTAISDRNTDAVIRLLDEGADPNTRDAENRTALIYAAATGQFRMMNALLEKHADIRLVTDRGETAASLALQAGNSNIAKMLE